MRPFLAVCSVLYLAAWPKLCASLPREEVGLAIVYWVIAMGPTIYLFGCLERK